METVNFDLRLCPYKVFRDGIGIAFCAKAGAESDGEYHTYCATDFDYMGCDYFKVDYDCSYPNNVAVEIR